ncbi:MAG: hypothetical protein LBQ79_04510 [Deltaproteobacteria bacterium]|jgi:hypothetical protein|nr:hypothetical protein [Deltaproteobacteria bacterium]
MADFKSMTGQRDGGKGFAESGPEQSSGEKTLSEGLISLPYGKLRPSEMNPVKTEEGTTLPKTKPWLPDCHPQLKNSGQSNAEHVQDSAAGVQGQSADGQGQPLNVSEPPTLPGFIGYQVKPSGVYGNYVKNTSVVDGRVNHDSEYLGKVENKDRGVFKSRKRGIFTFNLQQGYGQATASDLQSNFKFSDLIVLDFGDIWMIDHILNEMKHDEVIDELIPENSDTIKALIGYKKSTYRLQAN